MLPVLLVAAAAKLSIPISIMNVVLEKQNYGIPVMQYSANHL
jgi:hypothetical protein